MVVGGGGFEAAKSHRGACCALDCLANSVAVETSRRIGLPRSSSGKKKQSQVG